MVFEGEGVAVYFYTVPVDMRRSIDGLSMIVAERLEMNPEGGALYVFFNRSRDKLKILYWVRNGFCLWYKRLERERFKIPDAGGVLRLSYQQLRWLVDGLDCMKIRGHSALSALTFY